MDRSKIVVPRVDPGLATSQSASKKLGLRTNRENAQDLKVEHRYSGDRLITPITFRSHEWQIPNMAANTFAPASALWYQGDGSIATSGTGQIIPRPAKIIGGWLEISGNWTQGVLNLGIRITHNNSPLDIEDIEFAETCRIDGTDEKGFLRGASFFLPYDLGLDVPEGSGIIALFRTSSNWSPTTLDVKGSFLIAMM